MSTDVFDDVKIDEKITRKIAEPIRYRVVMLNDDQTPMEWVIDILKLIFGHSEETAKQITLAIHNEGSGLAGIYTYEIAEQKTTESTTISRQHGFPLQLRIEANE
jgi:ATP-dependent Clp protease adaptor protein ClpS